MPSRAEIAPHVLGLSTKQKKVNSTLSLKWMPLALNNSKLMPLAISLKGRAFQSKIAPSTQTALAGKAFLAANITEKSSTYRANCISNTQNRQNRKPS
jgi:hypothetical protein